MLTDEERGQIEAEIVKRIWRFESELRAAYADSTWIDNDIYHSDRRPNAGKLMTDYLQSTSQ